MGEKALRSGGERVSTFLKLAFNAVKSNLTQLTPRSPGIDQHSVQWLKCGQPVQHCLPVCIQRTSIFLLLLACVFAPEPLYII